MGRGDIYLPFRYNYYPCIWKQDGVAAAKTRSIIKRIQSSTTHTSQILDKFLRLKFTRNGLIFYCNSPRRQISEDLGSNKARNDLIKWCEGESVLQRTVREPLLATRPASQMFFRAPLESPPPRARRWSSVHWSASGGCGWLSPDLRTPGVWIARWILPFPSWRTHEPVSETALDTKGQQTGMVGMSYRLLETKYASYNGINVYATHFPKSSSAFRRGNCTWHR